MERENNPGGKRLVRPADGQIIGGVAAGVADYIGVEPTLVRLGFVAAAFVVGFWFVVLAYVAALIIIPESRTRRNWDGSTCRDESTIAMEQDPDNGSYRPQRSNEQARFWFGLGIAGLGVYFLLNNLYGHLLRPYMHIIRTAGFSSLLILVGLVLIIRRK